MTSEENLPPEENPEPNKLFDRLKIFINNKTLLIVGMAVVVIILLVPIFFFIVSGQKISPKVNKPISNKPFVSTAPYVADQLLVKYKDSYTLDQIMSLKQKLSDIGVISQEKAFDSNDPILRNFYVLKFKQGTDVIKIINSLQGFNEIEWAGPNSITRIQDVPNDQYYSKQWDLMQSDMPDAWTLTHGSNNVKVAVVDSGIDYNHPDLPKGSLMKNGRDFSTCNQYIGKGLNRNCSSPKPQDYDSMDDLGHGTHVAGTIGAVSNNSIGIAGISWNVTLIAVKVVGKSGEGTVVDMINGIQEAVKDGANVINMSISSAQSCAKFNSYGYQAGIDYALSKGVVVVAAAGNGTNDDGIAVDASGQTPASCTGVIAVGATNQSDRRAPFSNFGPIVDILAPGVGIISTFPGGGYAPKSGTSMAAPHVTAVAALLLSLRLGLSPQQVRDCIVDYADTIPDGRRLNAFKTLNACSGLAPITPLPTILSSTPTSTIIPTASPTQTPSSSGAPPQVSLPVNPSSTVQKIPTSTPVKTYTCRERSGTPPSSSAIQIGDLVCTQNP